MKRILLFAALFGLSINSLFAQEHQPVAAPANPAVAKPAPTKAGLKGEEMPPFRILETDSTTVFNSTDIPKGRSTVIIFFDPSCSHCINLMEKLFPALDSFKKVNFYMISAVHDISKLRKFMADYHTDSYKNIKLVGKDQELFFIAHYGLQRFPGAAVYDKHKKLVSFYESDDVKVDQLYTDTHQ